MALYKAPILNVSNLVPTAKLGTGTPTAANYLCGDSTWKAPTAALPDLVVTKNSTSENQTIADGYSAVKVGVFSVAGVVALTIQGTGCLAII